ncbi:hypothetical protein CLPU_6c00360 [Gottschalkia purinilytica]|uniref:DUF7210 domain-containing protein n=1 Tax=Gottschalkia purinilytica TaxID=1503 RepID=A0A0L0WB48_GOTPU|nr:hypothetical protein [Gottschalkia purinilytica]KNF08550.1 hypothetical protein CLPU_6c00360 [Gottschalkia purinilytica]
MDIVIIKGTIKHSGEFYGEGEVITGMKKEEAERLAKEGLISILEEEKESPKRKAKKADSEEDEE